MSHHEINTQEEPYHPEKLEIKSYVGVEGFFSVDMRIGIILEVERGKTIRNNMDLLDVWKCHICKEANHLFLVIPKEISHTPNCFKYSSKRLSSFFQKDNYINIDSLNIFGY